MSSQPRTRRCLLTAGFCTGLTFWLATLGAVAASTNMIRIEQLQGEAEILLPGNLRWTLTQTNQTLQPLDRFRTLANSRVTLRWSDQSVVSFKEMTEIEILPQHTPDSLAGLHLVKGIFSFLHRDKPGRIRVITRGAVAGVEGTEFVMDVTGADDGERTMLSMYDGKVRFSNDEGELVLTNGQQAIAGIGKAPMLTAGFIANNVLQWCFYYPAVLDLTDLPLSKEERQILRESLAAYASGDLLAALAGYPASRRPDSEAERVYLAALFLSVGQVEKTEFVLSALPAGRPSDRHQRLADALRQLIAAVKLQTNPSPHTLQVPTELLAASYYEQSHAIGEDSLRTALELARQATAESPQFSFAWARVAELEFSFGRTGAALEAVEKSLALAPRNAQALALKGFLLAGRNKTREAIEWFNRAIVADSALGNAWLGRGLCRIRRGDAHGGREDLLVAAALEPQRAFLRSYLGKAYGDAGDEQRSRHELDRAKQLDPADPTAWLYSALLLQQENQINEAVRDLEKSQALNDNRRVYRSQLLLDQDRAVRSANLANVYHDVGMADWSVQEAGRAVSADYANFSAHLFLLNSYDAQRDPNQHNLRYETPTRVEELVANLLAPAGAGTFSPRISQQEYSELFERDRLGLSSRTEYSSGGDWMQIGSQYGVFRDFSYSLDAVYHSLNGQRPNNDREQRQYSLQLKQQVTPQDGLYAQVWHRESKGGDLVQHYNQGSANPHLRTREREEPFLVFGYHREWTPAFHTLILGARLDNTYDVTNTLQPILIVAKTADTVTGVRPISIQQKYRSKLEIYSGELQQLWQIDGHQVVAGGRAQWGEFDTANRQVTPSDLAGVFPDPPELPADQRMTVPFERYALYGYYNWRPIDSLLLVGGASYDVLKFPANHRFAPISNEQETVDQLSPKAGIIWTPFQNTTLRGAYTRSLAGASIDQNIQLEPTQVAGLNQLFRSLIPESISGANAAERFETFGVSVNQRIGAQTYLGLSGELLKSKVDRTIGTFDLDIDISDFTFVSGTEERLQFEERTLLFTADRLFGHEWAVGTRYRLSHAQLEDRFVEMLDPSVALNGFQPDQDMESTLHQVEFHAIYNNPSGYFGQFQALWNLQSNHGYSPARPGDDFWQFNLTVGYRFPKRRVEFAVGLLNLTDRDYRLNPLTLHSELPRERTLAVRLHFNF